MADRITDFVSGTLVYDGDEERVVQLLARWLVSLGYRREQIQTHPQYKLKYRPSCKRPDLKVDLAVFQDERRQDDTLILMAECKRPGGKDYELGFDQLYRYMTRTSAVIGIVFNGVDLTYVFRFKNAGKHLKALQDMESPLPYEEFARYIKKRRNTLQKGEKGKRRERRSKFSVRSVATRCGIEPAYLSKIERAKVPPPSETVIKALARELGEDEAELMVRAGRLPDGLREALFLRPKMFSTLLGQLKDAPDETLRRVAKEVRDGDW